MTPSRLRESSRKNPRLRARRRRILESLESRCLLASLSGEVFIDSNENGSRDAGETGAANIRVYLDTNNNAELDSGEVSTTSDASGQYQFDNLNAGSYIVRVLTVGSIQTSPTGYLGTGNPFVGSAATQLFEMSLGGDVTFVGGPTTAQIHGLIRTNDGTLIGVDHINDGIYQLDPLTGQETLLSQPGVNIVADLAYDPGTDTIYTVTEENGTFDLRTVDKLSGQLGATASATPSELLAISASRFFSFDLETETATQIPRRPLDPGASTLDVRSDGTIVGVLGRTLSEFTVTPTGSTGTRISTLSDSVAAISFDSNDRLFGVSSLPSTLHRIDPTTGNVDAGVPITFQGRSISGVQGFDIGPDGTHYLVDTTHLYTFDPVSGIASQAPNRGINGTIFTSLTAAGDGSLFSTLFLVDTPLAEIDPVTGIATRLGNRPDGSPYSAVVAPNIAIASSGITGLTGVVDLAFDTVNDRIVGFDDGGDQFFEFTLDGAGSLLATSDRPLNSQSLAFDGTSFVMFDDDDLANTAVISVDPDTGAINPGFTASQSLPAESLFHSKIGDFPQRVALSDAGLTDITFGITTSLPPGVDQGDLGIYINELMLDPFSGSQDTDQYIELRGPAGGLIPDNTYLVVVDEDNVDRGVIHTVFDLSNQPLGDNGFLTILQQGHVYQVDPASAVLESTAPGFGGLPGNIYSDRFAATDRIDLPADEGANSFFLVRSNTPPLLGSDIDTDNDGFADPNGIKASWSIQDSISLHPGGVTSSQAYGDILLQDIDPQNSLPVSVEAGVPVLTAQGSGYAARIGDSIGSDADDWVFGTAFDSVTDPVTGRVTLYEFSAGQGGDPTPIVFNGRDLDHIGESNFNGGVRGTVTLFSLQDINGNTPPPQPGAGLTVFADINGNGDRDSIDFLVNPDNGIDPNNLFNIDGSPIPQIITNAFPGVTVSTADASNTVLGFDVTADRESNQFRPLFNRIFAAPQNNTALPRDSFQNDRRLRFDLYRPASEVSIEAIGAEVGFTPTYGRLEAYDANDNLLGSVTSGLLINTNRETITFTSIQENIAYAVAYADSTFNNGSMEGRFDNFSYRQTEAGDVTDAEGRYEIKTLFPGLYGVGVLRDAQSAGLIGGEPQPVLVTRNENFEIDFDLRPNVAPSTDDNFDFSIPENSPVGTSIGVITSVDPDIQQLTYSIESGAEFGVVIDATTGLLTVGPDANLDFEANSAFVLTVAVTDPFDFSDTTEVTIELQDLNEPPVVTEGVFAVAEGTPDGTAIGQIQAFDPDFEQDQFLTFSVIGGSGVGVFDVNVGNGLITLIDESAIDFEQVNELSLQIKIEDSFNPAGVVFLDQLIRVVDQNDPPVVTTTTISVPENSTGAVATLGVADPDAEQTHGFELVGGSGAELFDVTRDGTVVVREGAVIDFEQATSYTLEVIAIDNGEPPLAGDAIVTVLIQDVNEPPLISPHEVDLPENSDAGTLVVTIQTVDPEGVLSGYDVRLLNVEDAADFDFDPATRQVTVAASASLDFESDPTKQLLFEISDPSGVDATTTDRLVIQLVDQNDPPTLITESVVVSELAVPGTLVGKVEVQVREEDLLDTVTTVIVGGNAAPLFDLDAQTRILTVADGATFDADVEADPLLLQVEVTDGGGLSSVGTITIELNDVNEPPVFVGGAPNPDSIVSGEPFELVIAADAIVDPEGREFSLAVFDASDSLPSWLSFDEASRTLSGLPNPLLVGSYPLTLRAFEPGPLELFNDVNFTIVVERGNTPLTNQRHQLDVDANGEVAPLDALKVINFISRFGAGADVFTTLDRFFGFVDTSGDGIVTALDALLVINGIGDESSPFAGEFVEPDDDRDEANDAALTELLSEATLF